jgi:TPP-dependent pyruvate/acetoin dehydrogenase alpha subunit
VMSEAEIAQLERQVEQQIDEAIEFARNSPEPSVDQLMTDIYA